VVRGLEMWLHELPVTEMEKPCCMLKRGYFVIHPSFLQVSKEKGTASRPFGDVIVDSLSASSGSRKSSDQHMTGSTSLPFIVTANPYETLSGELKFITSYKDPLLQTNQDHSAI
jgi:hypothetical protein